MNNLKRKDLLGGGFELSEERDYSPEATKKALQENKLEAVSQVEVKDPITGKTSLVTIDRAGTNEKKLIVALADPDLPRDTKDHYLSMYLFERGKDNASMMVDLWRYKGAHTKESRAFNSQMRFDYEMMLSMMSEQMRMIARDVFSAVVGAGDIEEYASRCMEYLGKEKGNTVEGFIEIDTSGLEISEKALIILSIRHWTEADRFEEKARKLTENREKGNGKGIYLDSQGKPYSIYEDQNVDQVVRADMERINELKQNNE